MMLFFSKLEKLSFSKFLIVMVGLSLISSFMMLPLLSYLEAEYPAGNYLSGFPIMSLIISSILIAPWVETFLFQTIFFLTLRKMRLNDLLITLISSVAFGLAHGSIAHKLANFVAGLILCLTYILSEKRGEKAFIAASLVHALRNLFFVTAGLF